MSSLYYVAFLLSDVAYEQYKEGVLTAAAKGAETPPRKISDRQADAPLSLAHVRCK